MLGKCDDDDDGWLENIPAAEEIKHVTCTPSKEEIIALELDLEKLCIREKPKYLLGEGAFSQVYVGLYKEMRVAVKCLKIDLKKLGSLSKPKSVSDNGNGSLGKLS